MKALTYLTGALGLILTLFISSCSKDNQNIKFVSVNQTYSQTGGDTFDVNGDGLPDIFFRVYREIDTSINGDVNAIDVIGLNGARILSATKSFTIPGFPIGIPYFVPKPLSKGTTIDASSSTFADTSCIVADGDVFGVPLNESDWINADSYFGFSLQNSGQTHYGWFRINALSYTSLRVSGFAFDIRPNTGIKAGEE